MRDTVEQELLSVQPVPAEPCGPSKMNEEFKIIFKTFLKYPIQFHF